jgi:hypothetical protein
MTTGIRSQYLLTTTDYKPLVYGAAGVHTIDGRDA